MGMETSCTMMFGHIETWTERIEHLRRLRDLQDETGGFIAFIHWPFQPEGTPLGRWQVRTDDQMRRRPSDANGAVAGSPGPECGHVAGCTTADVSVSPPFKVAADANALRPEPDGEHLFLADAHDYLRLLAIARLYLDNIPNIQSSWVTMGPKIGQLALFFGANDMGSVMMEENVVSAAGTTFRLNEQEISRLIADAGWTPRQRDQYYRPVG
jgi:cyclic dehypoxanthinyl futalosine synthase